MSGSAIQTFRAHISISRQRRWCLKMNWISRLCVENVERARMTISAMSEGQTMTEYALILAAVAIVAYITYQVMGQDIGSMVSTIDTSLSSS
jgi:Flp pilus assembly pilin Flp